MRASGQTKSLWMEENRPQRYQSLNESVECEVCIVGSGVTGLTAAYLLAKQGVKVIVVTADENDGGETLRTTAHLTYVPDYRYHEIVDRHGLAAASLLMNSHVDAIKFIESLVETNAIDCQFKRLDGYLSAAPGTSFDDLKKEAEICRKIGVADLEEIKHLHFFRNNPPALRFGGQAQINIAPYLNTLQEITQSISVQFFNNVQVTGVKKTEGAATVVTKAGHSIKAKTVIIATGSPITDPFTLPVRQFAYRTYVIAARVDGADIAENLFWDTCDPYHYTRYQRDKNGTAYIIVGGEDHPTGQEAHPQEKFGLLHKWAQQHFPAIGEVTHRWSGQILEPADCLPFIGKDPLHGEGVYVASGTSGNGITYGTTAALLITDLINKNANPLAKLFAPERLCLKGLDSLISENLCSGLGYANNLKIYRKQKYCTHLSAALVENSCENSLDCPAHGSRFNKEGEVISGPAVKDL